MDPEVARRRRLHLVRAWASTTIERVYFRGIVFGQSWEDPAVDRLALRIAPSDRVLSITSGGCSTLNLLCLRPKLITSIDGNPAQTSVLQLKLAALRTLEHHQFFTMFGTPDGAAAVALYRRHVRSALGASARRYWDANERLLARGLASQGKLGLFIRIVRWYLKRQLGEQRIRQFFEVEDLDRQRDQYYADIRPRLFRPAALRLLRSPLVLALGGMHPNQYHLLDREGSVEDYLRDRVDYVLTSLPIGENYFAAQVALGAYADTQAVPPYLLEANFPTLRDCADRVDVDTVWLLDHLRSLPDGAINKFNLMDIFDWMDPFTRDDTFREVVRVGAPGARFIFRSAVPSLPLPADVEPDVAAEGDLARELFATDRTVTYSSFHVYQIGGRPG